MLDCAPQVQFGAFLWVFCKCFFCFFCFFSVIGGDICALYEVLLISEGGEGK